MRRCIALTLTACAALALPATAPAATKKTLAKTPVVSSVSPLRVKVGDTLIVRGRNFLRGSGRNTVVFKRDGAVAVFVRAGSSSTTRMRVKVPNKLLPFFKTVNGKPVVSRFRIRVLAKRFGRSYTATDRSPLIEPLVDGAVIPGTTPVAPAQAGPPPDCDGDGTPDATDSDDDNDLLADALEQAIKTDPCKADTDGDTITDGYEYVSALDLNDSALPYPGKRPYPNPLDGADAFVDHDGDSLLLIEEYAGWKKYGNGTLDLNLSDGTQKTKPVLAADYRGTPVDFNQDGLVSPAETAYLDLDGDGELSDEEQDIDHDGLSNYDETHGRMLKSLIDAIYEKTEKVPYPLDYAPLDWLDPDTDGDTLPDGADDQDHDDVSNIMELSRILANGDLVDLLPIQWSGWVHPFNPCLPDYNSRTCGHYWPPGEDTRPAGTLPRLGEPDFAIKH